MNPRNGLLERLTETDQRVVDAGITMRMYGDDVADQLPAFDEVSVGAQGAEDAPLHALETVDAVRDHRGGAISSILTHVTIDNLRTGDIVTIRFFHVVCPMGLKKKKYLNV